MPGASLRVQVWPLKQGDTNNSGLHTMEGGISLTHQVSGGHSPCSERSWRGPGTGSVVPFSDVGSSHHPRLLATTSSFQLGGPPVPFTDTTSKVHTFPPTHTPHWPGYAHMAAPPSCKGSWGRHVHIWKGSDSIKEGEMDTGGHPAVCPTRPRGRFPQE